MRDWVAENDLVHFIIQAVDRLPLSTWRPPARLHTVRRGRGPATKVRSMTQDKQLLNVALDHVVEKRRLDQTFNTKEFAVLAGISYSTARDWFRQPGFPAFRGYVFWQDFVQWRTAKNGLQTIDEPSRPRAEFQHPVGTNRLMQYSPRVAKILCDAGVN